MPASFKPFILLTELEADTPHLVVEARISSAVARQIEAIVKDPGAFPGPRARSNPHHRVPKWRH
jgi:hypothetical protein